MTVKQEKDKHQSVWVSGATPMPEGSFLSSHCPQLDFYEMMVS